MLQAFDQLNWFLPLCLLSLGLVVGSFLNVVIYRLPLMMESRWRRDCCELLEVEQEKPEKPLGLATPNSHCPHCKAAIKPWHNIPVVSYLALGGKCANCGTAISWRYPAIETVTGLMTLALAWHFSASPALLGAVLFTWALGETYVSLQDAVIGAMAGYMILWSIYWLFKLLTGKEGMGYGDFKLLAALGAWLGWQILPVIILLSSLVGAVCGIALMVIKRRGKEIPIPFGPYLAAAGWIALLWGEDILSRYLGATGLG
jgi:leader peptidase (prepilin peptidase)/N-methyltransferase